MQRCEHCDELQEEVRQLRKVITLIDDDKINQHAAARDQFKLTPGEFTIFIMMHERLNQWVSITRLEHANEPSKADYIDPSNNLKVRISRIRRKCAGHFRIVNRFGEAYKLEPVK